jgi:hypothetical protein
MVALAVLSSLLLAASAVAIPTSIGHAAPELPNSRPLQRFNGSTATAELYAKVHKLASSKTDYSTNWAGASYTYPAVRVRFLGYARLTNMRTQGTFKAVQGTIVIPKLNIPSGGSSSQTYWSSAWVGIDGASCGSTLWQTGFYFTIQGSNQVVTRAYPLSLSMSQSSLQVLSSVVGVPVRWQDQ